MIRSVIKWLQLCLKYQKHCGEPLRTLYIRDYWDDLNKYHITINKSMMAHINKMPTIISEEKIEEEEDRIIHKLSSEWNEWCNLKESFDDYKHKIKSKDIIFKRTCSNQLTFPKFSSIIENILSIDKTSKITTRPPKNVYDRMNEVLEKKDFRLTKKDNKEDFRQYRTITPFVYIHIGTIKEVEDKLNAYIEKHNDVYPDEENSIKESTSSSEEKTTKKRKLIEEKEEKTTKKKKI